MSTNPNPFSALPSLLQGEPAGTLAMTVPRSLVSSNGIAGGLTGIPNARIIALPAGLKVSNIGWASGSTAEVAGTHFWVGLMDQNSNVLGVSADQTGAAYVTAATYLVNALTAPVVIPATGFYYCVVSISAATTMPTSAGGPAIVGGMNSVSPVAAGQLAAQAAPPAVGANLGAITAGAYNAGFWLS